MEMPNNGIMNDYYMIFNDPQEVVEETIYIGDEEQVMSLLSVMEKVSIRLIQSQPFYASLLSQFRKIECTGELAKQIPTEAVAVENGRINFYYNPSWTRPGKEFMRR